MLHFSKDPFTIDVTRRDILANPLAIRPHHVIYGQPLTIKTLINISTFRPCTVGWRVSIQPPEFEGNKSF